MMVKIHFENLASGMKAKIDPAYRHTNKSVSELPKLYGKYDILLGDSVAKNRPPFISKHY